MQHYLDKLKHTQTGIQHLQHIKASPQSASHPPATLLSYYRQPQNHIDHHHIHHEHHSRDNHHHQNHNHNHQYTVTITKTINIAMINESISTI